MLTMPIIDSPDTDAAFDWLVGEDFDICLADTDDAANYRTIPYH